LRAVTFNTSAIAPLLEHAVWWHVIT